MWEFLQHIAPVYGICHEGSQTLEVVVGYARVKKLKIRQFRHKQHAHHEQKRHADKCANRHKERIHQLLPSALRVLHAFRSRVYRSNLQ